MKGSVRSLEAALVRLVAYASLQGKPVGPDLARLALGRQASGRDHAPVTPERIQAATAQRLGLAQGALLARDRRPEPTLARHIAMYLSRELTDEALPAIGRAFGNRNHTTVLHAHRKIAERLPQDEELVKTVESVRDALATA